MPMLRGRLHYLHQLILTNMFVFPMLPTELPGPSGDEARPCARPGLQWHRRSHRRCLHRTETILRREQVVWRVHHKFELCRLPTPHRLCRWAGRCGTAQATDGQNSQTSLCRSNKGGGHSSITQHFFMEIWDPHTNPPRNANNVEP